MRKEVHRSAPSRQSGSHAARHDGEKISAIEVIVIALVILAIAWAAYRAVTPVQPATEGTTTVKVRQAQTLWEIASEHRIADATTAETVELIKAMNGMEDSSLLVGQNVQVPVTSDQSASVASR